MSRSNSKKSITYYVRKCSFSGEIVRTFAKTDLMSLAQRIYNDLFTDNKCTDQFSSGVIGSIRLVEVGSDGTERVISKGYLKA